MQNYKDLKVWDSAHKFVLDLYKSMRKLSPGRNLCAYRAIKESRDIDTCEYCGGMW